MSRYEIDSQAKFLKLLPVIAPEDQIAYTGTDRLRLPDGFRCAGLVTGETSEVTCEGDVDLGLAILRGPVILRGHSRFDKLMIDGDLLAYGDIMVDEGGAEISGSAIVMIGRIRCDSSLRVQGALVVEHDPEGEGVLYCDLVTRLPGV